MYHELDTVVLTHDIEAIGLKAGDVGAIVYVHSEDNAFEVEFVDAEGKTVAVLTLNVDDVRSMQHREILHVRDLDLAVNA